MTQYQTIANLMIAVKMLAESNQDFYQTLTELDKFVKDECSIIDDGTINQAKMVKVKQFIDKAWQVYRHDMSKKVPKPENLS